MLPRLNALHLEQRLPLILISNGFVSRANIDRTIIRPRSRRYYKRKLD
jgi:hypothetical protein